MHVDKVVCNDGSLSLWYTLYIGLTQVNLVILGDMICLFEITHIVKPISFAY